MRVNGDPATAFDWHVRWYGMPIGVLVAARAKGVEIVRLGPHWFILRCPTMEIRRSLLKLYEELKDHHSSGR